MIAFEVKVNGKRVCVAGADDLGVLSATVTAAGKLGRKTVTARPDDSEADLFYHVGGLTSRAGPAKDVHVNWRSVAQLRVGDVVQVTVVDTDKADRARSRKPAAQNRRLPKDPFSPG